MTTTIKIIRINNPLFDFVSFIARFLFSELIFIQ